MKLTDNINPKLAITLGITLLLAITLLFTYAVWKGKGKTPYDLSNPGTPESAGLRGAL